MQAFTKMKTMCELEERHGVDLGKNNCSCSTFMEFNAHDLQEQLMKALSRSKFFSSQADGSTDAGTSKKSCFWFFTSTPTLKMER